MLSIIAVSFLRIAVNNVHHILVICDYKTTYPNPFPVLKIGQ